MQINPYVAVLLLLGLLVVSWRFTRRKRAPEPVERVRRPERKVEGFQVWSPLHVRIGRGCVFDHGMQYGPGFRRKEGPLLPHDPNCVCETLPFTFTGSEVFAGALRRVAEPKSLEPEFPASAIRPMFAALKRINAEPTPADVGSYLALVGMDTFAPADRDTAEAFLRRRHTHLTGQQHNPVARDLADAKPAPAAFASQKST